MMGSPDIKPVQSSKERKTQMDALIRDIDALEFMIKGRPITIQSKISSVSTKIIQPLDSCQDLKL